jgi:hypothetical protein
MVLFVLALLVALLGVGAYDLYNPGTSDVTMADHHLAAVPDWAPIAAGAGLPLSLFLLYALWTSIRIQLLKRARRTLDGDWELMEPAPAVLPPAPVRLPAARPAVRARSSAGPRPVVSPQPAPKRSWLPPD